MTLKYKFALKPYSFLKVVLFLFMSLTSFGVTNAQESDNTNKVTKSAQFPGGYKAWNKFFKKEIQYPEMASNLQASGECTLRFTVNTDGSITDIVALNCRLTRYNEGDIDKYPKDKQVAIKKECVRQMAKEAFRLIRKSKRWEPAKENGVPVKSIVDFTITFNQF